jgi:hypothetical protein
MVTRGRRSAPAWVLAPLLAGSFTASAAWEERSLVERQLDALRCSKNDAASCVERLRAHLKEELGRPELARIGGGRCAPSMAADCGPVFDDCTPVAGLVLRALSELDEAGAVATGDVFSALERSPELEPFVFYALENFRRPEILPLVVERLNSSNVDCRWSAYFAIRLLELRPFAAVARLNVLVESADWDERTKAAASLARIGDPSSVAPLTRTLRQPPASAQKEAAHGLASIGPKASPALPELEKTARTHWAWSVRQAAADSASTISGKAVNARRPTCKTSAIQVESRWIVTTEGKRQTLDPVEGDSIPGAGTGACAIADGGWDLFPLLEEGEVCVAGKNEGEWGGKIILAAGREREVLRGGSGVNPIRSVRLGNEVFVIEGLHHLTLSAGMVTRLWKDPRGRWLAEPFLELPGAPLAFAVRGKQLLLLTDDALDREDEPCPSSPGKNVVPKYLLRISADGSVESLP